ncbi:sugar transferase [Devosia rhodophyticola]|uniref:Sugar transferase n=1 Tax=Devosia rhodophyticola TaxID=3026423 RepID=A0ABY7Z263_9HYPH|nr:sugar transferase [Devosia rhodophyticola]WDR07497.1 sugar transferase [Devosia rhodophyticola]
MKRALDVLLSAIGVIVLSPVFVALAVIVRVRLGGPVFYTQMRPGKGGRPFRLIKFRSMTDAHDLEGNLLHDAARLPAFGRLLRATSLDELPELWNVLRGDMSLVGPRPLLMEYLPLYSAEQARRHNVRPGITGWAQVNGRNAISWTEKFALDVWYVDNQSLALDIRIVLMTLAKVVRRDGVTAQNSATADKFTGSP